MWRWWKYPCFDSRDMGRDAIPSHTLFPPSHDRQTLLHKLVLARALEPREFIAGEAHHARLILQSLSGTTPLPSFDLWSAWQVSHRPAPDEILVDGWDDRRFRPIPTRSAL